MASSRDDFIIAIRSAFLKKSNKQKFSLLTLVFLSILIIILSTLDNKLVRQTRSIINEFVYRSSFIVSIPENFLLKSFSEVVRYSTFYKKFDQNLSEIEKLRSEQISNEIIKSENKELKALIEDYSLTRNKILAKVIVDHNSPFLKSLIINKGSKDNLKIGTNIYDKNYLVGKVIEVNYRTSRVLLISDLNSNLPITVTPGEIQAIITGDGKNNGIIKYVKGNYSDEIENKSIAYTSGSGSIYKSGIPVGRIEVSKDEVVKMIKVNFYSNFDQLKYVFAEIEDKENKSLVTENKKASSENNVENFSSNETENVKIDILSDQIEIISETNSKLLDDNAKLKIQVNEQIKRLLELENKIISQNQIISQNELDKEEFKFLKLNLIYSKKCKKTFSNPGGYKEGSSKYRECVLNKGKL